MNMMINMIPMELTRSQPNKRDVMSKQETGFHEVLQRQQKNNFAPQQHQGRPSLDKQKNMAESNPKDKRFLNWAGDQHGVKKHFSNPGEEMTPSPNREVDDKEEVPYEALMMLIQKIEAFLSAPTNSDMGTKMAEEMSSEGLPSLGELITQLEEALVLLDSNHPGLSAILKGNLPDLNSSVKEGEFQNELRTLLQEMNSLVEPEGRLAEEAKGEGQQLPFQKAIHTKEVPQEAQNTPQEGNADAGEENVKVYLQENGTKERTIFSHESLLQATVSANGEKTEHNFHISPQHEVHRLMQSAEGVMKSGEVKELLGKNITNQILPNIVFSLKNGKSEVNLQLVPENLGKLAIKLELSNGTLSAKLYAESNEVKQIIETNLNQLKSSLEEKGMTIGSLNVFVGQDAEQAFHQHMGGRPKMKAKSSSMKPVEELNAFYEEETRVQTIYTSNSTFEGVV